MSGVEEDDIERAAAAIAAGELVVYPTETVYGLGAAALDTSAVERVFEAKGRSRSKPLSMAVPDVGTARQYSSLSERELAFCEQFLPGPVTVVVERDSVVPDILTAGSDRVGIRVPDDEIALTLLAETGPITATSANVSGTGSVRRVDALDDRIRDSASVVLDAGERPGGGSTVVDVAHSKVHRRGALAEDVEEWLATH